MNELAAHEPGQRGLDSALRESRRVGDIAKRQLDALGPGTVRVTPEQDWGTAAVFKDPDGNQFVLSSK